VLVACEEAGSGASRKYSQMFAGRMQVRRESRPAMDAGEGADRDRLLFAVHVLASPIAVSIARFDGTGEGACEG